MALRINDTARKHQKRDALSDADILRAAEWWEYAATPSEDMPAKEFRLGFDEHGRLLEIVVLKFDSGEGQEAVLLAARALDTQPSDL